MSEPDTSILSLHRCERARLTVRSAEGGVWRMPEDGEAEPLSVGDGVDRGDTVALAPGAWIDLGDFSWAGGRHGAAHALVPPEAFKSSPRREDVPRLIAQLSQIEREMEPFGEDPLTSEQGPVTPYELAQSAEFARLNLDPEAARCLPEEVARRERAVCLFVSEDTVVVAMHQLTVPRLRAVMAALQRPVNPHLVEEPLVDELLDRVYGP